MWRTFSKIYGLARLRLGWAYGPTYVIDAVNRIRCPFNVNGAAIEAGIAALADTAHTESAVAHNQRWCSYGLNPRTFHAWSLAECASE